MRFKTIIAIDWSGSKAEVDQRKKIWACTASVSGSTIHIDGLECGRTRLQILEWLNSLRQTRESIIVGFDFAFSFPAGFRGHAGIAKPLSGQSWSEFCVYAEEYSEKILETCPAPFWGHTGKKHPDDLTFSKYSDGKRLRETDVALSSNGGTPKEIFQIGGAGSVGTGSLRGMQILNQLRSSGWSIWPFEDVSGATAIEIYPRHLYQWTVNKTDALDRERYLKQLEDSMDSSIKIDDHWLWSRAMCSDDSFDAFTSCIAMAKEALNGEILQRCEQNLTANATIEGHIWRNVPSMP